MQSGNTLAVELDRLRQRLGTHERHPLVALGRGG
jgi:hypothetical protein